MEWARQAGNNEIEVVMRMMMICVRSRERVNEKYCISSEDDKLGGLVSLWIGVEWSGVEWLF